MGTLFANPGQRKFVERHDGVIGVAPVGCRRRRLAPQTSVPPQGSCAQKRVGPPGAGSGFLEPVMSVRSSASKNVSTDTSLSM